MKNFLSILLTLLIPSIVIAGQSSITFYDADGNVLREDNIGDKSEQKVHKSLNKSKKNSSNKGDFQRTYKSTKACYDIAAMAHLTALQDPKVKESFYEHGVATIEMKTGKLVNYTCIDNVLYFTRIR